MEVAFYILLMSISFRAWLEQQLDQQQQIDPQLLTAAQTAITAAQKNPGQDPMDAIRQSLLKAAQGNPKLVKNLGAVLPDKKKPQPGQPPQPGVTQ